MQRDLATGASRGFGFVSYDSFEASDAALEAMNGQFLMNKAITIDYAFKKEGKGERHGTQAERLLAAQARKNNALPQTLPPPPPPPMMGMGQMGYGQPAMPGMAPPPPAFGAPMMMQPPPPPPPGFNPMLPPPGFGPPPGFQ